MLRSRWGLFIFLMVVGAICGLLLGWIVFPTRYEQIPPRALRIDYQADYVLMTAQLYQKEGDLVKAVERLAFLGDIAPSELLRQALLFAEPRYADADLVLMRSLDEALAPFENLSGETEP